MSMAYQVMVRIMAGSSCFVSFRFFVTCDVTERWVSGSAHLGRVRAASWVWLASWSAVPSAGGCGDG